MVCLNIDPPSPAPPPTSVQPDFNIVKLGTPHTLTCQVISTRTIAFSWIVGGVAYEETSGRIIISNTPTTSTLTLRTLEEGDLGNVTCVATDPVHRPVSFSAVLQESPSFYIYGASERRNFTLQVDSPFRLDCGVRGGPATVRWFKGRQEIPAQGDGLQVQLLSNGTSSLRRETTLREDHGSDYLCKAERSGVDSSLTQQFNIFIFGETFLIQLLLFWPFVGYNNIRPVFGCQYACHDIIMINLLFPHSSRDDSECPAPGECGCVGKSLSIRLFGYRSAGTTHHLAL